MYSKIQTDKYFQAIARYNQRVSEYGHHQVSERGLLAIPAGRQAERREAERHAVPAPREAEISGDTGGGSPPAASGYRPVVPGEISAGRRRSRGLLLGLALGDAIGAGSCAAGRRSTSYSALPPTVVTQLTLFTVDGLIRASVGTRHRGPCHTPSVVWHAYARWAKLQDVAAPGLYAAWRPRAGARWPDGWLADVPALRLRRGSAPATVHALARERPGTRQEPATASTGAHALTRTWPVGLLPVADVATLAADLAALTHTGEAVAAAAVGAGIIRALSAGGAGAMAAGDADEALAGAVDAALRPAVALPVVRRVRKAVDAAAADPASETVLCRLAPDLTAVSALAGAVYVAMSMPGSRQVADALTLAARAPGACDVAASVGAILGAVHGVSALPVQLVSRLELVWVTDVLARDLVQQLSSTLDGRGASAGTEPGAAAAGAEPRPEPDWLDRYPGW